MPKDEPLTMHQFADLVGISYGAMVMRRSRGDLPPPDTKRANRPMWKPATANAYLRQLARPQPGREKSRFVREPH